MPGITGKIITSEHSLAVRFNEVDSMGIVWHGNYVQYLEDARENFGMQHHIDYLTIASYGYQVPVVDMSLKYKKPLRYGDSIKIVSTFIDTKAAKIIFRYEIYNEANGELCTTAETIQVFIDLKGELQVVLPSFFTDWKIKVGLL